jgi:hypothetical protein
LLHGVENSASQFASWSELSVERLIMIAGTQRQRIRLTTQGIPTRA